MIKDGKLVGKFEDAYRDFEDPYGQTTKEAFEPSKALVINACEKFRMKLGFSRAIELGCGFGVL
jgi:hypothetical protein